jgi:hypothetical protein
VLLTRPLRCLSFSLSPIPFRAHLQPALDPKIIANRCTAKWVKEFLYIRATATGALARFMDFVT